MTYPEFIANAKLQEAVAAYTAKTGGRFVCEEPGIELVYLDADGEAYSPPSNYTADALLTVLESEADIRTSWLKLEDEEPDPDILY